MSDITVFLTTSKFAESSNPHFSDDFKISEVPICVGQMGLGMFGFGHELESFENMNSKVMLEMAQIVEVDPEKHTVFIGLVQNGERIGLLEYDAEPNSITNQEFFRRWKETQTMLFEFVVYSMSVEQIKKPEGQRKTEVRWAVRGLWHEGKWEKIGIFPSNNLFPVGSI